MVQMASGFMSRQPDPDPRRNQPRRAWCSERCHDQQGLTDFQKAFCHLRVAGDAASPSLVVAVGCAGLGS